MSIHRVRITVYVDNECSQSEDYSRCRRWVSMTGGRDEGMGYVYMMTEGKDEDYVNDDRR